MTGSDDMADAFFRANGMLRVDLLETLFELPALIAGQKPAARHRVAAMTTTGGGAATVVDRLGTLGVEVVPPTAAVIANLARRRNPDLRRAPDRSHARRREEGDLQRGAERAARLRPLRPGAGGGGKLGAVPAAHRDRPDPRSSAGRQAARGVLRAAGRRLARAAGRSRHCRLPHAGSVRRRDPRLARLARAARGAGAGRREASRPRGR